jgi:hypothetical protein
LVIVINRASLRAGRKRKSTVVRRADGKSDGERFDREFFARQPHRRDIQDRKDTNGHVFTRDDARAGYSLGRLWMRSIIDDDQHRAGIWYTALCADYGRLMGIPMPNPKSGFMAQMVSGGFYNWSGDKIAGDDLERNRRIRAMYDECYATLNQLGLDHHQGNRIHKTVNRVCILEEDWPMVDDEIGNLRLGLNAIGKLRAQS